MSTGVKINELPSGNFNAKVFDYTDASGKRHYKSITAPSKKEVKRLIAEFLINKDERKGSPLSITVGQAIDKYIESKNNVLSPSTVRGYKMIRKNNMQNIMRMKVENVTQQDVQQEINKESETHSPKTVKNMHALLTAALTLCGSDLKLQTTLPQKVKPDIQIPTDDEMKAIFADLRGKRLEIPVYLAAMCGMRRSEIAALKWEDVDLENGTLTVRAATVINEDAEYVIKGTKTTAGKRTIKLFKPVLDLLKKAPKDTEFVTEFQKPSRISNSFVYVTARLGLKNYRFHDLRHYAVSTMLSLNLPKNYIADYMGHETERMIDEVYGHIKQNAKEMFMSLLDDYYIKISE
jgi:integrase